MQGLFKAAVKQQSLLEKVEQQGNLANSEAWPMMAVDLADI